jgi:hypothetical protein
MSETRHPHRCGSNFADATDRRPPRAPPVASNVVNQNVGFPFFMGQKLLATMFSYAHYEVDYPLDTRILRKNDGIEVES